MNQFQAFRGTYTAIVTPFNREGNLDVEAFKKLVELQVKGGVSGIVICGTTGEGPTVTEKEFMQLIKTARETTNDKIQIIAGTGTNNTSEVIRKSLIAKDTGAHGLLISAPYYNKPTQAGLVAHYTAIADSVDLPIMVYNVPGRSAVNILPQTIAQLAKHPNIVSVKEASGDINQIMDVIQAVPSDFSVLAGDDMMALPAIAAGAEGVVSVISNEFPSLMSSMTASCLSGDFEAAKELHYKLLPMMKANFRESNPIVAKAVLAHFGLIENVLRLPLVPMSESLESEIFALADSLK